MYYFNIYNLQLEFIAGGKTPDLTTLCPIILSRVGNEAMQSYKRQIENAVENYRTYCTWCIVDVEYKPQ